MSEIRDAFRFYNFTVDGNFMEKTCEFNVFDWTKDNNREYYAFNMDNRTISLLGNYDNQNQGQINSHQNGYGLLLVKFY
jgi:hypothetical protein